MSNTVQVIHPDIWAGLGGITRVRIIRARKMHSWSLPKTPPTGTKQTRKNFTRSAGACRDQIAQPAEFSITLQLSATLRF